MSGVLPGMQVVHLIIRVILSQPSPDCCLCLWSPDASLLLALWRAFSCICRWLCGLRWHFGRMGGWGVYGNAMHAVRTQCKVLDVGKYSNPSFGPLSQVFGSVPGFFWLPKHLGCGIFELSTISP